jgi:hypothetical protein
MQVSHSGTVVLNKPEEVRFSFAGIEFGIEFKKDSGKQRLEEGPKTGKSLILHAYNLSDSLGAGTTVPLEVGFVDDHRLFLAFVSYSLNGEAPRIVHYTFYLGGKKDA